MSIDVELNGKAHSFDALDPEMPLLWALRDYAGMTGVKFGCVRDSAVHARSGSTAIRYAPVN